MSRKRLSKQTMDNKTAEVDQANDSDSPAEAARKKYLYRKLVMNQGIKIPARLAMKMVGPDCAFHLYSQHMPDKKKSRANDE